MELIIGAFILAGVILVTGMIVLWGESSGLFGKFYFLKVEMDHVAGLREGAPVKIGGVRVGSVTDIRMEPDTIVILLKIEYGQDIHTDADARIATAGIVGDAFLELIRGTERGSYLAKVEDPTAEEVPLIQGEPPVSMDVVLARVDEIGQDVSSIVSSLEEIIADPRVQQGIKETVENIRVASGDARSLLSRLRDSAGQVDAVIADVRETTGRIREVSGTVQDAVNRTVGDEENIRRINDTLAQVHRASQAIGERSEEIGAIIGNTRGLTEDARGLVTDARVVASKGREIADRVGPDKGILTFFTQDDIVGDVQEIIQGFKSLVEDKGIMRLMQLWKYAEVIADKKLEEWGSRGLSSAELTRKVLDALEEDDLVGREEEAKEIIEWRETYGEE
jgi:phospholipid/cholesterol/gamma-HCH transport system substrate-binding protein